MEYHRGIRSRIKPTVWATFVELQVLPFFYLSGKRSGHRKRRCVCKKEIMGKCQRDYEKTVIIKKNKEIEDLKNNYDKQELKMLKNIRTPIISVIGMGDYCNKFSCEIHWDILSHPW